MITLIASLTGFLGSIIPYLLNFLKDVSDKKHELEILDRQISMQKEGISQHLEEIKISENMQEMKSLYRTFYTKIPFVDAINGMVRPVLAYAFFALYVYVKYKQIWFFIINNDPAFILVEYVWSGDDQAIFAGIISFYFGQRAMSKISRNKI